MKKSKQHIIPLAGQLLFGRQVDGVIQMSGRPATKRGGFLLDINFTIQSTLRKRVVDTANDLARNADEYIPAKRKARAKKKSQKK